MQRVKAELPSVVLEIVDIPSADLTKLVLQGRIDFSLSPDQQPMQGLVRTPLLAPSRARLAPLLAEGFVAALPLGNPLAHKPEIKMEELAAESFVIYSREDAAGLHATAMLACQRAGFLPRVTQEATQVQTVLSLVESGLGVALVPAVMQYNPSPRVAYRAIADLSPAAEIGLALLLPEPCSPAAQRFREVALHCFGDD